MKCKVYANAKINLTLDIVGTDQKGYHLIDSVFQSVSLNDEITIEKTEALGIEVLMPETDVESKENIVFSAAQRFFEAAKKEPCVKIFIKKGIPLSAGLGGGSCDAAVTLLALNKMFDNPLDEEQLFAIALSLGADVPFALEGGTMRAKGIGEELEKLSDAPDCFMVLIKNGVKPSTKEMYARLDALAETDHPDTEKAVKAIKSGDLKALCKETKNVFAQLWDLKDVEKLLKPTLPLSISLSGSGPTVFAIYEKQDDALKAFNLAKQQKMECYVCSFAKSSAVFE